MTNMEQTESLRFYLEGGLRDMWAKACGVLDEPVTLAEQNHYDNIVEIMYKLNGRTVYRPIEARTVLGEIDFQELASEVLNDQPEQPLVEELIGKEVDEPWLIQATKHKITVEPWSDQNYPIVLALKIKRGTLGLAVEDVAPALERGGQVVILAPLKYKITEITHDGGTMIVKAETVEE